MADRQLAPPRQVAFAALSASTKGFSSGMRIGEGTTGDVFRTELDGIPRAVKILKLPAGGAGARDLLEHRFRAEMDTLAALEHPRVVRLIAFAIDEVPETPHPYAIVFELLEGGSLADWLRLPNGAAGPRAPERLGASERVDIALGVASGLSFIHGQRDLHDLIDGDFIGAGTSGAPMLHRDIKSANIGLTRAGAVFYSKLLDCGMAKAMCGDKSARAGVRRSQQGSSISGDIVVGTLGYMAPELACELGTLNPVDLQ